MHVRLPSKMEEALRYLRLKFLPRTLFFRTMLLIFIPLIAVQVVSVVVFFDGSWSRMGRRLSDNLAADMSMIIRLVNEEPKKLSGIQQMAVETFNLDFEYYDNAEKHKIISRATKGSPLVVGYLEEALARVFPNDETRIYLGSGDKDLVVMVNTEEGLFRFITSKKKIFSSSIFMFVVWMAGTSVLLFLVAVLFLRIQVRSIAELDGYLSFVSGEGGEKSSFVDMNEMILSIINKFRNKDALIRYSTNDQVSAIQGREQALKRALTNIISNAFRYGKTIAVNLESNDKKLTVCVEDDGPGIPADKRDDVFKAFYRLENSRNKETGGVGLGLSIAKDVVTSHGGTIELGDSELGGLKVLISIPL